MGWALGDPVVYVRANGSTVNGLLSGRSVSSGLNLIPVIMDGNIADPNNDRQSFNVLYVDENGQSVVDNDIPSCATAGGPPYWYPSNAN